MCKCENENTAVVNKNAMGCKKEMWWYNRIGVMSDELWVMSCCAVNKCNNIGVMNDEL
jgi:hypothetical protein